MDKTDVALIICIAIIGVLVSYTYHSAFDTVEYKSGYTSGYTEHNQTKYNAACEIEKNVMATNQQRLYAIGYIAGNDAYNNDESAKVLGC